MKKYLLSLTLLGLIGTACNSKLDIAPPNTITDEQVAALLIVNPNLVVKPMADGLAATFRLGTGTVGASSRQCMNLNNDMRGNDFVYATVRQTWHNEEYRFSDYRSENSGGNAGYWNQFGYARIAAANRPARLCVAALEMNPTGLALAQVQYHMARALTFRSMVYLQLAWLYTPDYVINNGSGYGIPIYHNDNPYKAPAPRGTIEELWKGFIIPSLDSAVMLFTAAKASGLMPADEMPEPLVQNNDLDITVANATLAYAALSCGLYAKAIAAADAVIAAGYGMMDEDQYVAPKENGLPTINGFSTISMNPEAIFSFTVAQDANVATYAGAATSGWLNIYGDGGYGGSGTGYAAIDARLYDMMDDADYRKQNFRTTQLSYTYPVAANTETLQPYFNEKFAATYKNPSANKDNIIQDEIYYRLSEMYLIKAEAQARNNNAAGAETTINELIALRAPGKTIATYGPAEVQALSLLERIQLQWRIEMWGENGLEYYNNKRWGVGVDRLATGVTGQFSTHGLEYAADGSLSTGRVRDAIARNIQYAPNTPYFLWQLPLTETNYNPDANEKQNPY